MTTYNHSRRNPFLIPIIVAAVILLAMLLSPSARAEAAADPYAKHGLKRLVDRVIYKEGGEYRGSIPKMQSKEQSGFKIAALCKVASTSLKAIYKKDLNGVAEYYSDLFGQVYTMALDSNLAVADGAVNVYQAGHSEQTAQWAGQRMAIVRSAMSLIHGDLALEGPAGMPELPKLGADLSAEEFTQFMLTVKQQAEASDALTTNMAAALASSPSKLNGLVDKCSFLIKSKIAGLLADPAGGDSAVPEEMRTAADKFNPQNVGDLYLALGVIALHIQNPEALSKAEVTLPAKVLAACDLAKANFKAADDQINTKLAAATQGQAKWDSAPLGPAKVSG